MRASVCALAKMENAYINDWVRYHLELGFDHIWLYDNNEKDYPYVGSCISDEYKSRVTIVDWRDRHFENHTPNKECYDDWLRRNGDNVDWCAFIDIDEFIHLDGRNLREWLERVPLDYDGVILNWHVIGDDGIVVGDESVPVYERLFKEVETSDKILFKTILRCDSKMSAMNPHVFRDRNNVCVRVCDCEYELPNKNTYSLNVNGFKEYDCWINHYATKTISEFLKYKLPRLNREHKGYGRIDYFFLYNEKNAEKEKYVRENYIL